MVHIFSVSIRVTCKVLIVFSLVIASEIQVMGSTTSDQTSSSTTELESIETERESRKERSPSVADTLAKWKDYNGRLEHLNINEKPERKAPAKGSKKGCMKGKGGPENANWNYRAVRQRTWGKWVAEIREPRGRKLWLGTFSSAVEAACAYDEAAKAMYGSSATLNFPKSSSQDNTERSSVASGSMSSGVSEVNYDEIKCEVDVSKRKSEDTMSQFGGNFHRGHGMVNESNEQDVVKGFNETMPMYNVEEQHQLDYDQHDDMFDVDELLQMLSPDNTSGGAQDWQVGTSDTGSVQPSGQLQEGLNITIDDYLNVFDSPPDNTSGGAQYWQVGTSDTEYVQPPGQLQEGLNTTVDDYLNVLDSNKAL